MSPRVLTTGATITCPHRGSGTSTPGSRIWTVDGNEVLRATDTGTLSCSFYVPCASYVLRSMGLNATLLDGQAVVLETDLQQSATGLPLTVTETHHTYDDSTPAPLPAPGSGEPEPAPDPALQDTAQPQVAVVPPSLAFTMSTSLPPVAAFTFVLASTHPRSRTVTLLNTAAQQSVDLTAGTVPGASVTPPGETWDSSPLTVVVTLTAAFMAALGPSTAAPHELYVTGVSQRGIPSFARATLAVSA